MGSYLSSTDHQQKAMLDEIGYKDYDDLFGCVPDSVKLKGRLSIRRANQSLSCAGRWSLWREKTVCLTMCSAERGRTATTSRP